MKISSLVLLVFALRHAAATDDQYLGPSADQVLQFTQAVGGDAGMLDFFDPDDSDVSSASSGHAKASAPVTMKSAQHGPGKTFASLLHISDKQSTIRGGTKQIVASLRGGDSLTGHTANGLAGKTVQGLAQTVKASAAIVEDATSMQLKIQLAKSKQVSLALRQRFQTVASSLLVKFRAAKIGAQRSQAKLRSEIKEESAKRKQAEALDSKLMAQLAAAKASALSTEGKLSKELKATKMDATQESSRLQANNFKLRKEIQEESAMRKKAEASDSKVMAQLSATKASALSTEGKLSKELKATKMDATQESSRLQANNFKLRKEIQEESATQKKAEASDSNLMAQLSAAKASALSTADRVAMGKLSEELKATKMQAAQETNTHQDQLDQLQQELAKAQSQITGFAKAHQSQVTLQNEMTSMLTAEMNDQKAKAELSDQQAKAEVSKMVAELSLQKTQAAASEVAVEETEAEMRDQLAAAKASELSSRRSAAAVTAQAAAKSDADREEVRKLRGEFQKRTATLKDKVMHMVKAAQDQANKKQMLAKEETSQLRGQLRQARSQLIEVQKEPVQVSATTLGSTFKAKAAPSRTGLQKMTNFFLHGVAAAAA